MKINKRVLLGIEVITALKESEGPTPTMDLAKKIKTTVGFLEQIMRDLRKSGLVISKQGPGGGYEINQDRMPMTALDIALAVGQYLEVKSRIITAQDRLNDAIMDAFYNTKI